MTPERVKRFFQEWGIPIFLAMATVMMGAMWIEVRSRAIAAAETRDRIIAIEARLLSSKVPDRLERIERRQEDLTGTIEDVLGVPVEPAP